MDGATSWQAFRKVIVPLAAPGVFTTAIISFFIAWTDFRLNRQVLDPNFAYYRMRFRDDSWARNLSALYTARSWYSPDWSKYSPSWP